MQARRSNSQPHLSRSGYGARGPTSSRSSHSLSSSFNVGDLATSPNDYFSISSLDPPTSRSENVAPNTNTNTRQHSLQLSNSPTLAGEDVVVPPTPNNSMDNVLQRGSSGDNESGLNSAPPLSTSRSGGSASSSDHNSSTRKPPVSYLSKQKGLPQLSKKKKVPTTPQSSNNNSGAGPSRQPRRAISRDTSTDTARNIIRNAHTSASLYCGDLHPDVTESALMEIFSQVGAIQSVRVCRDVVTRRSLGYAYINFFTVKDAQRALDTVNFYASPLTKQKPLRIMWKIRDPTIRKSGEGNIFVKGLDPTIDNKILYDTFAPFGDILSCKVAVDAHEQSLGYGFVHFAAAESATAAIDQVDGMFLGGQKVSVGHFLSRREREASGHVGNRFTNIYVKNIPESLADEEVLFMKFSEFGEITSIYLPRDEDGMERGFAFVNYSNADEAMVAVAELNGKIIDGAELVVCRAQKRTERDSELRRQYDALRRERVAKYQGVNLYVKNLTDDFDEEKLRELFSEFGTVSSCKIMCDERGFSRGFGFVCYSQAEEATRAVTELNGRLVGAKPIYVALAQHKEARRAQLEAQRAAAQRVRSTSAPPPAALYAQPSPSNYLRPGSASSSAAAAGVGGVTSYAELKAAAGYPPTTKHPLENTQHRYVAGSAYGQNSRQPRRNRARAENSYQSASGNVQQNEERRERRMTASARQMDFAAARFRNIDLSSSISAKSHSRNSQLARVHQDSGCMDLDLAIARARTAGIAKPQIVNRNVSGHVRPQKNIADTGSASAAASCAGNTSSASSKGSRSQLTVEMLTSATAKEQKQMLGEQLYPKIIKVEPHLAAKITGMLLEMELTDILHMLEEPEALKDQVARAVDCLRVHESTNTLSK